MTGISSFGALAIALVCMLQLTIQFMAQLAFLEIVGWTGYKRVCAVTTLQFLTQTDGVDTFCSGLVCLHRQL